MKHYLATLFTLLLLLYAANSLATPSDHMVHELNKSVLRVKVDFPNGKTGLGSAVVVVKDEVVTNCHVVADATAINVIIDGSPHEVSAIKTDWRHDLCMLTVKDLNAPVAKLGASKTLQYETSIFTVGYPDETVTPVNTHGVVKALFPLDDSVVIRATNTFRLGASGGGAFDDAGNLVGVITLKSKGDHAYYYFMPVEWVQALMKAPAKALNVKSEKPFWAMEARPYFMQVVQPFLTQDWKALSRIATQWVKHEPTTAESWFYLAAAEFAVKDYAHAKEHFNLALSINHQHVEALNYLQKIAEKTEGPKNVDRIALLE